MNKTENMKDIDQKPIDGKKIVYTHKDITTPTLAIIMHCKSSKKQKNLELSKDLKDMI